MEAGRPSFFFGMHTQELSIIEDLHLATLLGGSERK